MMKFMGETGSPNEKNKNILELVSAASAGLGELETKMNEIGPKILEITGKLAKNDPKLDRISALQENIGLIQAARGAILQFITSQNDIVQKIQAKDPNSAEIAKIQENISLQKEKYKLLTERLQKWESFLKAELRTN